MHWQAISSLLSYVWAFVQSLQCLRIIPRTKHLTQTPFLDLYKQGCIEKHLHDGTIKISSICAHRNSLRMVWKSSTLSHTVRTATGSGFTRVAHRAEEEGLPWGVDGIESRFLDYCFLNLGYLRSKREIQSRISPRGQEEWAECVTLSCLKIPGRHPHPKHQVYRTGPQCQDSPQTQTSGTPVYRSRYQLHFPIDFNNRSV